MNKTQKTRSPYWDNVKCLLIFLVVVGHFVDSFQSQDYSTTRYVFLVIYTFHMPLFIFIGGLFSKSTIGEYGTIGKSGGPLLAGTAGFPVRRVGAFLFLYVAFKGIRYLLLNFCFGVPEEFQLLVEEGLPWYMIGMAMWISLTYFVRRLPAWLMMTLSIAGAFLIGFWNGDSDFLAIMRVVNYYPFFLLGYYLDRSKMESLLTKRGIRVAGALVILAFLAGMYVVQDSVDMRLFTGRNSYAVIEETLSVFQPWMRVLYYPCVCILGAAVLSLVPRRRLPWVTACGGRTLAIYFLHRIVLYVLWHLGYLQWVIDTLGSGETGMLVFFFSALVLTFLLSFKWLSVPFDKLMGR